jgi:hypothetical protein
MKTQAKKEAKKEAKLITKRTANAASYMTYRAAIDILAGCKQQMPYTNTRGMHIIDRAMMHLQAEFITTF